VGGGGGGVKGGRTQFMYHIDDTKHASAVYTLQSTPGVRENSFTEIRNTSHYVLRLPFKAAM
jgi:hypothetical protein